MLPLTLVQAASSLVLEAPDAEIVFQAGSVVISAASMQSMLDRLSALEVRPTVATGTVIAFAGTTAPEGYLVCDGSLISKTTYQDLYGAIGDTYGQGTVGEFQLPDLRGEFIRGFDGSRGIDDGRTFGSSQIDEYASHSHPGSEASTSGSHSHSGSTTDAGSHVHTGSIGSAGGHSHTGSTNDGGAHSHTLNYLVGDAPSGTRTDRKIPWNGNGVTTNSAGTHSHSFTTSSVGGHTHSLNSMNSAGSHSHSISTDSHSGHTHSVTVSASGGAETRPRNVALLYCIKT